MDSTPDSAIVMNERSSVSDWQALGDLVAMATQRLTDPVEGVHHAIADRWSALAGRRGGRSERVLTRGIYRSVRLAGSVAGVSIGVAAATFEKHRPVKPLWDSPGGAGAQAAVNALWGDEFERRTSPIHIDLGIRNDEGAPVPCDTASLARAFPGGTPRLAVLLHGLGKTEHSWNTEAGESGDIGGLPRVLEADGFTPVLVRYNTGKRVSDNGAALARVLDDVVANWPTGVDEIVLIGHSMGGLVALGSLLAGRSAEQRWVDRVRHVVTLGTPHSGSPIEKGVDLAEQILERDAVSRPVSQFIGGRSAGIKDMRYGTIHDDRGGLPVAPDSKGVRHHHVASVITDNASHPVGFLLGDLVVRVASATGIASKDRAEPDDVRVFGGLHHMGMLYDADVHSQIREWLTPSRSPAMEPKP